LEQDNAWNVLVREIRCRIIVSAAFVGIEIDGRATLQHSRVNHTPQAPAVNEERRRINPSDEGNPYTSYPRLAVF